MRVKILLMKFWKEKFWLPVLSVAFLLGLLVLLAGLQYKWLGQVSDAEKTRMDARLKEDTRRFTEDFDREIQTVFQSFQVDSAELKNGDWTAYNKRFAFWNSQTKYPQLIKDIFLIKKGEPLVTSKFERETTKFREGDYSAALSAIEKEISFEGETEPIDEKRMALLLPIIERENDFKHIVVRTKVIDTKEIRENENLVMPGKSGFLVVLLDQEVIKNILLPDLVARYFSDGESGNFRLSVANSLNDQIFRTSGNEVISPDSTSKMFSLNSGNFAFFSEKIGDTVVESDVREKEGLIISKTIGEPKPLAGEELLTVELKGLEKGSTLISRIESKNRDSGGIWTLQIQHNSGSLEQFITNARNKNLAISFGILSLLAVSMVLIFISAQRAKALAQKQVDFVSSVSHEFRTPLAVIYSASENLSDGVIADSEKVASYGTLIKHEGKKMSAMVEQILEFAGARSGNRKYDFRTSDVETIIHNALSECKLLIDEKGFEVEMNIDKELPMISADANALSHAIQNLVINSIKYSNGSRWLKISAKNGGEKINISVEDKGIGIAKKDQLQIFEPFYRSKEVVDEQIHGNGLGLSLVKQIVEAHSGKVIVNSEIGKGSTFVVHLPLNR